MAPPYMPFYVSDYEAATAHLTIEEDGVYNRLLRLCWRTDQCLIPNDPTWVARHMRVDIDTYNRVVAPIINEFFKHSGGRIFQPRQREEFKKTQTKSETARKNGKKGGRKPKPLKRKDFLKPTGFNQLAPEKSYPEPEPEPEPYKTTTLTEQSSRLLKRRESELYQAAEIRNEHLHPGFMVLSEPISWLSSGCDFDLDILPVIKSIAARGKKIVNWRYCSAAVFEARDRRIARKPPPTSQPGDPPETGRIISFGRNYPVDRHRSGPVTVAGLAMQMALEHEKAGE